MMLRRALAAGRDRSESLALLVPHEAVLGKADARRARGVGTGRNGFARPGDLRGPRGLSLGSGKGDLRDVGTRLWLVAWDDAAKRR
jgi:hypothetical protein